MNYGEKISAVGASDSHTVGSPVGQGRTYIRSSIDDAAKINVDEACKNLLAGDSSISLGIFADVVVAYDFKMGQLAPLKGEQFNVNLRVAAPSWVKPQRALVFLNGEIVAEQKIISEPGKPTNQRLKFLIPVPRQDAYLVCVVLGDGVPKPVWPTEENYTLAATNPVFLDADRDGIYRSPRETAQSLLAGTEKNLESQWRLMMQNDDAIAIQLAELISENTNLKTDLRNRMQQAIPLRPKFGEYLKSLQ